MVQAIFWGSVLRVAEAMLQASPTILVGLVVAAVFERFLGHQATRRLFGTGTARELPQAWLVGMLLPICSLGVIPVARQMRKAGISGGAILAFAMTAPLFNPLSMLYGFTLSSPAVILAFAFCTMIVVTAVGVIWNRIFPDTAREEQGSSPAPVGLKRMTAIFISAARCTTGPSLGYTLFAFVGIIGLSIALPPGSLMSTMEHSNPYAPVAMAAVAIPAYATPLVAMSQLGSMFQHANSVGAAFVLLTLGAGINLGLIAWIFFAYGPRRASAWMAILLAVVLSLAYAIENPLHPREIEPAGHTHAFDIYCRPFETNSRNLHTEVANRLKQNMQPYERVAVTLLLSLVALGLMLKVVDRRFRVEDWIEEAADTNAQPLSRLDIAIPAPALGGCALAGFVVFSIIGCYAYYPEPREVFKEMSIIRAEVLTAATSGNRKHAEHYIPIWQDWTRRLQVGSLIREGSISAFRRMKAKLFRDRLELLKHAIEEEDREEAREYALAVDKAYQRMRVVYLGSSG